MPGLARHFFARSGARWPDFASVAKAQDVCERLRRLVVRAEGVTGSFGVASFPAEGGAGQELIEAADQALYRAKHARRDQVWAVGDASLPSA